EVWMRLQPRKGALCSTFPGRYRNRSLGFALTPPLRPTYQTQMCRIVNERRHQHEIRQQVNPPGHELLLHKQYAACPVHIVFRPPEVIDGNEYPALRGRSLPSLRVVTQPPDGPQENAWRHHMKQTQRSHQQWQMRIEHELRTANEMMAVQPRSHNVDR